MRTNRRSFLGQFAALPILAALVPAIAQASVKKLFRTGDTLPDLRDDYAAAYERAYADYRRHFEMWRVQNFGPDIERFNRV